ncbi:sugar ABC transporter permease [Arthrobacter sp. StoSoilB5]|uniref:carbohydrate ABC transporter permease n=1 Tax=Arthrobacter sp. StoSoilB5 TaxID=2830992 RepID=UPI001CC4D735|nr:sugar ABC transporter permease [Arthrobacter sp. StoSoilB5]
MSKDTARKVTALRNNAALYWLSAPAVLLLAATLIAPMVMAVNSSLHAGKTGSLADLGEWIGFANYQSLFSDPALRASLVVTVFFCLGTVVLTSVGGYCIALVLVRKSVASTLVLILVMVGWAMPLIVNGLLWRLIYDPVQSPINSFFNHLGVTLPDAMANPLGTPTGALIGTIVAYAWKMIPFTAILLFGALQERSPEIYAAAKLDGANIWQTFRHLTLPLTRPVLLIVVTLSTIWSLREFDTIYVLTKGGPGSATTTLNWFAYTQTFEYGSVGLGTALAVLLGGLAVVITAIYTLVLGEKD